MPVTILTRNGANIPATGQLAAGELAVDLTALKLYSSTNGTDVVEIAQTTAASVAAVDVSFDNTDTGLTATDVQEAIDEHVLDTDIHFADAVVDGNTYARKDGAWVIAAGGGSANWIVGEIKGYIGLVGSLPAGWHVCDGTDSTPDLRGRSIFGAGNTFVDGTFGGQVPVAGNTEAAGTHNHTASTSSQGSHDHVVNISTAISGGVTTNTGPASRMADHTHTGTVDNGGGHSHSITVNNAADHSHVLSAGELPPYGVVTAWIMYTGV